MDKRRFITAVLSTAAAAAAARSAPVRAAGAHAANRGDFATEPRRPGIAAVIYDERYSDAREFASALESAGATAFASAQDPVPLWYRQLAPRSAREDARFAGLTPHSDLSLLAQCAAAHDLALLYEGVHDCRWASTVSHSLRARGGLTDVAATAVFGAGPRWPGALAAALHAAVLAGVWARPLEARHSAPRAIDHPGTLVSWVIGPA